MKEGILSQTRVQWERGGAAGEHGIIQPHPSFTEELDEWPGSEGDVNQLGLLHWRLDGEMLQDWSKYNVHLFHLQAYCRQNCWVE